MRLLRACTAEGQVLDESMDKKVKLHQLEQKNKSKNTNTNTKQQPVQNEKEYEYVQRKFGYDSAPPSHYAPPSRQPQKATNGTNFVRDDVPSELSNSFSENEYVGNEAMMQAHAQYAAGGGRAPIPAGNAPMPYNGQGQMQMMHQMYGNQPPMRGAPPLPYKQPRQAAPPPPQPTQQQEQQPEIARQASSQSFLSRTSIGQYFGMYGQQQDAVLETPQAPQIHNHQIDQPRDHQRGHIQGRQAPAKHQSPPVTNQNRGQVKHAASSESVNLAINRSTSSQRHQQQVQPPAQKPKPSSRQKPPLRGGATATPNNYRDPHAVIDRVPTAYSYTSHDSADEFNEEKSRHSRYTATSDEIEQQNSLQEKKNKAASRSPPEPSKRASRDKKTSTSRGMPSGTGATAGLPEEAPAANSRKPGRGINNLISHWEQRTDGDQAADQPRGSHDDKVTEDPRASENDRDSRPRSRPHTNEDHKHHQDDAALAREEEAYRSGYANERNNQRGPPHRNDRANDQRDPSYQHNQSNHHHNRSSQEEHRHDGYDQQLDSYGRPIDSGYYDAAQSGGHINPPHHDGRDVRGEYGGYDARDDHGQMRNSTAYDGREPQPSGLARGAGAEQRDAAPSTQRRPSIAPPATTAAAPSTLRKPMTMTMKSSNTKQHASSTKEKGGKEKKGRGLFGRLRGSKKDQSSTAAKHNTSKSTPAVGGAQIIYKKNSKSKQTNHLGLGNMATNNCRRGSKDETGSHQQQEDARRGHRPVSVAGVGGGRSDVSPPASTIVIPPSVGHDSIHNGVRMNHHTDPHHPYHHGGGIVMHEGDPWMDKRRAEMMEKYYENDGHHHPGGQQQPSTPPPHRQGQHHYQHQHHQQPPPQQQHQHHHPHHPVNEFREAERSRSYDPQHLTVQRSTSQHHQPHHRHPHAAPPPQIVPQQGSGMPSPVNGRPYYDRYGEEEMLDDYERHLLVQRSYSRHNMNSSPYDGGAASPSPRSMQPYHPKYQHQHHQQQHQHAPPAQMAMPKRAHKKYVPPERKTFPPPERTGIADIHYI